MQAVSVFQFPIRNSVRSDWISISQIREDSQSFNSPFGILFVRTMRGLVMLGQVRRFQFPIRNSVRSDVPSRNAAARHPRLFQFPIRNSVRSDWISISQIREDSQSFNSPFGILFVRTMRGLVMLGQVRRFQFPIRNSVRSD